MPPPRERADRRRVATAVAIFLTGVGLAFASAALWGASVGVAFLLLGLVAASAVVIGNGECDDKPPHP